MTAPKGKKTAEQEIMLRKNKKNKAQKEKNKRGEEVKKRRLRPSKGLVVE